MKRREFLRAGTGAGAVALAGCAGAGGGDGTTTTETTTTTTSTSTRTTTADPYSGTLTVATYQPFVDAPSVSPGGWIKESFEAEYPDATLEWATPDSELNYYIQRRQRDVDIDADVYVGMNADDLVRIDDNLGDTALFDTVELSDLENADHVRDDLRFDPQDRAIPFDTGYISLVYDGTAVENPGTFEALTGDAYDGKLIVQNAQTSDTGQAFLLWTIATLGEDAYLDYWDRLVANDVRILRSWSSAYTAYSNGEAPIVVSYSTDQVYASRSDQNLEEHQVGFLNDQGYANPEGMARFADTDKPELATAFMEFMLSVEAQSQIPVLNVSFPAVDNANLPEDFSRYAFEPPEAVTHSYDELAANLDTWVEDWARRIATK
ncbi:thiamine ABC transporter substrate binding subunit [Halobacteriaceae archaeon GCM10025711]